MVDVKSTKKSVILMKASISVIRYKHKVLANGESPLMVRIQRRETYHEEFGHIC